MGEHQPPPEHVAAWLPVARDVLERWGHEHPNAAAMLSLMHGTAASSLEHVVAKALAQVEAGDLGVQGALQRALQRTLDRGRAR